VKPLFEKATPRPPTKPDQEDGILFDSKLMKFSINGPLMKRTVHPLVTTRIFREPVVTIVDRKPDFLEFADCVGRDQVFQVIWKTEGAAPLLKDSKSFKTADDRDRAIPGGLRSELTMFLTTVARPNLLSPEKFFPSKDFVVTSLKPSTAGGAKLLRVDFEIRYNEAEIAKRAGSHRPVSGWFITRPDDGWVIQEFQLSTDKYPNALNIRTEFGQKPDGIALPKKITRSTALGRTVLEIDELRHAQTPEDEFTLAAFGLLDVRKP
jgi:hypothetical protein